MKPTQFVVLHSPGPTWQAGLPAFEQSGLELHVAHCATLLEQGLLLMGGPFLDERSGGMMVADPAMAQDTCARSLPTTRPFAAACSASRSACAAW